MKMKERNVSTLSMTTNANGVLKAAQVVEDPGEHSNMVGWRQSYTTGTKFRTPSGEKCIEAIVEGDEVEALIDGKASYCKVIWTGYRDASPYCWSENLTYPLIRIVEGAIAEKVPDQDLLVPAGYGIAFGCHLIPTHMLVNGASILYDREAGRCTQHYFATEKPSILWANNLPGSSMISIIHHHLGDTDAMEKPYQPSWTQSENVFVPFNTQSDVVEPIASGIRARAAHLGLSHARGSTAFSHVDVTCQVVDTFGRAINPTRRNGNTLLFNLKGLQGFISLKTPAARPCDAIGPYIDDRRNLGLLIGKIMIISPYQVQITSRHLSEPNLLGWNSIEEGLEVRWTTGQAMIPMDKPCDGRARILSIEVKAFGPYLDEADVPTLLSRLAL